MEYTPRLSAARRRAKRCGKVSELPAVYLPVRKASSGVAVDANFISAQVGAAGEDAALLYDLIETTELDAARTPPSTDNEDDALALMALSRS